MYKHINNNYGLNELQINQFIELYPNTRGRQLMATFGLNLNQIRMLRNKFDLEKDKYVCVLTKRQIEDFKYRFMNTKNSDLMKRYKITRSQLNYLRKNLGIRKREFKK